MDRRRFLKRSAMVGGAFLTRDSLSFAKRNLGFGTVPESAPYARTPPRSTTATGRVEAVNGETASVNLNATAGRTSGRVVVVRREYPTGDVLSSGVSDRVTLDESDRNLTRVDVPRRERNPGTWFYEAYVRSDAEDERRGYVAESAPFRWSDDAGVDATPADRVTAGLEPTSDGTFTRRLDGNEYVLTYEWQDSVGETWTVEYPVRRSVHEAAVAAERGYVKTYEESVASPIARDFADAMSSSARRTYPVSASKDGKEQTPLASLDAARRFDVLVRFVQGLDYARDIETMGTYDYNRTVPETLVAGVGDCQERTYLLAGLLSTAFDCETALMFQVGHVFLGVAPTDVPSLPYDVDTLSVNGAEYVPIEPSLVVPVGYYPDKPLIGVYDDGWLYHDASAMARGFESTLREWLASSNPVARIL